MQNLKKAALAMCLVACMGFGFADKAHAEEVMPSSGVAYEDLDREISNLEFVYEHDKNSWASVTDLSLLYYDRGDYQNCYKMSKRALKLYEDGRAYENDEDILRESLVKGAAAAYNLGEYKSAEKLLKNMISLNLRGSDDNAKTYMGWAYYYLSNIERIRGNYDRSHFYGGIAINYCPHYDVFVDYWGCFYRTGIFWHWRHHHHHDYRPPMPPPRPHWRDHGHRHDVHKPVPAPHNRYSAENSRRVEPRREQAPIHQPRHDVKHPALQGHTVHQQSRPAVQQSRPQTQTSRPTVSRPQEHRPAVQQSRPQTQTSRPSVSRPQEHRPAVQQSRPQSQISRPTVSRPQGQRPVYQSRPQSQSSRPTISRPQGQRPVYQSRPQTQQTQVQRPVYQPRQDVSRPAPHRQAPRQHQAPQGNHRRR
ncbi:MAG: hypothetical protein MJ055_02040 [Phascolarctobacterium sp.]|nr:hypothetical protein [Phascolarctobacterium sp.]